MLFYSAGGRLAASWRQASRGAGRVLRISEGESAPFLRISVATSLVWAPPHHNYSAKLCYVEKFYCYPFSFELRNLPCRATRIVYLRLNLELP